MLTEANLIAKDVEVKCGISASHVPVLVYLAKKYRPETILEIGSGALSTLLFLDSNIYPDLKLLTSVEEDPVWFKNTSRIKDPKLHLLSKMPSSFTGYDMIFIDGPQDKIRRGKVVGFVMRDIRSSLIVIHDIDYKPYRRFINFKDYNEHCFDPVPTPQTGLYSTGIFPTKEFNRVNRIMRKRFDELQENWTAWNQVL